MPARLPNFLIVGAAKCGTTSLHAYLAAHPQVFVPEVKEVAFFGRESAWVQGLPWYEQHFSEAGLTPAVGEATPDYMFSEAAVKRIASTLPDVRAIVCLREPGARAYSHYLHWHEDKALETRSFEKAIEAEFRSGGVAEREGPETGSPYFGYLARGRYDFQLQRLTAALGRDQIHIVFLEELREDPAREFAAVCRFLGIDDTIRPAILGEKRNPYHQWRPAWLWKWMVRHRVFDHMPQHVAEYLALRVMAARVREVPRMPVAAREQLSAFYRDSVDELEKWLGRPLPPAWTGTAKNAPIASTTIIGSNGAR